VSVQQQLVLSLIRASVIINSFQGSSKFSDGNSFFAKPFFIQAIKGTYKKIPHFQIHTQYRCFFHPLRKVIEKKQVRIRFFERKITFCAVILGEIPATTEN
jgi:hypothetical protein